MGFLLCSWIIAETRHSPTIGFLPFLRVDFLRGESFWSLSYPVLLQPESQVSPGQGGDPQAGWGMTTSWRSNPRASWGISASQELGPWQVEAWACRPRATPELVEPSKLRHGNLPGTRCKAGRGRSTSWDPWSGGSLSRLKHGNLPGTRSLDRLRNVDLLGPLDWRTHKHVEVWQPPRDQIPGQIEAGWHPGIPRLVDAWAGWGVTTSQGPDP